MTRSVLRTTRLELRPMRGEHLPLLVELDSDPEVLKYILGRARTADESCEFWAPKSADTTADAFGLGWWVGFVKDEFVGWWVLSSQAIDVPVVGEAPPKRAEAGWRLARRWWRHGLAAEDAAAVFEHGFAGCGLQSIWAETMATNHGSRGVMRRLGMQHVRTEHREFKQPLPGTELGEVIYEISQPQWAGRDDRREAEHEH